MTDGIRECRGCGKPFDDFWECLRHERECEA